MKRLMMILAVAAMMAAGTVAFAEVYKAEFTSVDATADRFDVPVGYAGIYNGGPSSGGVLDGTNDYGLSGAPDYTGWNADHTGVGHYDDPSRGWTYGTANDYTDAYSETEETDSGYVELEWTFENVASAASGGYILTVTAEDLDDYVAKKGEAWASVPDEWKVYVNGGYVGDLYDYDDPNKPGQPSVNNFDVGDVSGSVKIEINGAYFDLLHDDAYYGIAYGKYASWGDVACAQHGIRLEGLELRPIPEPGGLGLIGLALLAVRKKRN